MINHNVVRFHISMHNALAVAEIKSLEQFMYIEAHIEVGEFRIQATKVDVVDIFEDERRSFALQLIPTGEKRKKKNIHVSYSSLKRRRKQ